MGTGTPLLPEIYTYWPALGVVVPPWFDRAMDPDWTPAYNPSFGVGLVSVQSPAQYRTS